MKIKELAELLKKEIDKNNYLMSFSVFKNSISFKIQNPFSSNSLKYIFSVNELDWKDWIEEWRISPTSRISITIDLFIKKEKVL